MSPRRLAVAALCLVAVIAGAITAYVALRPGEP